MLAMMLALPACGKSNKAPVAETTPIPMQNTTTAADSGNVKVKITTTMGDITVLLYGDTPKHRDNFIRLVDSNYYDSTLFHRVIDKFMIQAGDPDSRTARPGQHLGAGGPDYKIDAEIVFPRHFHKRGALAAARQGDQVNPLKQSSGSQFYIVTGDTLSEPQIAQYEQHMRMSRAQGIFNQLAIEHRDSIIEMQRRGDRQGLQALQNTLVEQAEARAAAMPVAMTPEMRAAYTTVGGAPHLDGEYTVFGEVIDGMDVVARIEAVETDAANRPRLDVRILRAEIVP